MALRDQPYLPLYIQDYMTDEMLAACSFYNQGIYVRIMCVFHKSETYGGILFKQIPKQNFSTSKYFAYILSKQTGVSEEEMANAIEELLFFSVLRIMEVDGVPFLYQKRMVHDFEVSEKRSKSAKKGGGNPALKEKVLFKQTSKQVDKQNTEYENQYKEEVSNSINTEIQTVEFLKDKNGKTNQYPTMESHGEMKLFEGDIGGCIQYYFLMTKTSLNEKQIKEYFEAYKIQHFTGKNFKQDYNAILKHFRDWLKFQTPKNSTSYVKRNIDPSSPSTVKDWTF